MPEYSRLVISLSKPIGAYTVRRADVNEFWVEMDQTRVEKPGRLDLQDALIEGVVLVQNNSSLLVRVRIKPNRFSFRHFASVDKRSLIVDVRSEDPMLMAPKANGSSSAQGPVLNLPSPKEIGQKFRKSLPETLQPNTPEALLAEGAEKLAISDYKGSAEALEALRANYPTSPLLDPGLFLLGDAYYNLSADDFAPYFLKTTSAYQEGVRRFPDSTEAARASLMIAMAYKRMNYSGEAIGYFRLVKGTYPDSAYGVMADVHLGELYADIGNRSLAKSILDGVAAQNPRGDMFYDAYYSLGDSFAKDGLYTQANEIFKEILTKDEQFYTRNPQILYQTGEGYFNLKRPDLARMFLYHFINIAPQDPSANLAMARLGDAYREEGKDQEAIQIYASLIHLYPGTPGALVGQMRLADYGALRNLFTPDELFFALEDGAHAANIKMYEKIIESQESSPMVELALFKMANDYFSQEEYRQTIDILKKLMQRFPGTSLRGDASELCGQAMLAEIKDLMEENKFVEILALAAVDKSMVSEKAWPEIRDYLARAYFALNVPEEAAKYWESNLTENRNETERLFGLGQVYIRLRRYVDAVKVLESFRQKYPNHALTAQSLFYQAEAETALGRDAEAVNHLEKAIAAPGYARPEPAYRLLETHYAKAGDIKQYIDFLERYINYLNTHAGAKEDMFLAGSNLGASWAQYGKKQKAEEALAAALKSLPQKPFPETLYRIAHTYRDLNMPDEYKATLELIPPTDDPFWKQVAREEILSLTPNEKISRLLSPQQADDTGKKYDFK